MVTEIPAQLSSLPYHIVPFLYVNMAFSKDMTQEEYFFDPVDHDDNPNKKALRTNLKNISVSHID